MYRPLRDCALVLTVALLMPLAAPLSGLLPAQLSAGEVPADPLLPPVIPVVPVTPPVTPAPAKPVTATPVAPVLKPLVAVPTDAAQTDALKTLKAAFKEEFAARRKTEDRQLFARVLLEQGHTATDDTERFVVLSEASAQAAKAGDHTTVLAAQDALAAHFTVNARELRLAALADVAPNLPTEEAANATLDAMLLLAEVGIAKDDYPFTARACKEADALARRLNNTSLATRVKTIADRAKYLGDEFKKIGPLEEDLLGSMAPESHLRLGQFLCFAKGDWQSGLPHLAECGDAALQTAATNELIAISDPAASVGPQKIADGWYDLSQKQKKSAKEEIYVHALTWYRRAAPSLKGPEKLKLEKRIDELVRALEATGRTIRYPAGANLLLTFERETLSGQGASVTHVLDISGHNLRANATGPLSVESGSYGLALKCDGKSWLFVSNCKDLQITGSHTIAFWMRPDVIGIRQNPFHKKYDSENSLVLEPEGSLNYLYGIGSAETYQVLGLAAAGVPKRWTHVALVRDLTAKRLMWYKDGKKASDIAAKHPVSAASTEDQLIGNGYCNPFNGLLDDVGLWPRALSEAEIRQMYDATSTGR